jgi:hypothetical protein
MFTIEMNEPQLRNLKMFLERSEMRGYEINQFLSLVQAISDAKPAQSPEMPLNKIDT